MNIKNEFEIEKLLDEIEENQLDQLHAIEIRDSEINQLKQQNTELKNIIINQKKQIDLLNNEIEKLKSLLVSNEQKFRIELEEKVSELYSIMEMSKKIDDQNKEIQELEKNVEKQKTQLLNQQDID